MKKRVVLKVGSAVLTEKEKLATQRLKNLVEFIVDLKDSNYEVILVSSGAVAAGYTVLQLNKKIVSNKQALASIGQPLLMKTYKNEFKKFNTFVAQLLLTADDLDSRKRTQYAKNAIETLLSNNITPIINENDVTATDELLFGDNDQLAAHVTYHFDADMLVILTDIDGYYDKNPRQNSDAKLNKIVHSLSTEELAIKADANSEFATGGIATKLKAAKLMIEKNKKMYLSSGFDLYFAREFLLNNHHKGGTLFYKKDI
jgi:glutamate 5-kinase